MFNQINASFLVKNILIINILLFLATWILAQKGINLMQFLGLHHWKSENFMPHQLITHAFMHANFFHLAFNMYALYTFGNILEWRFGSKSFFVYYLFTTLIAATTQLIALQFQISLLEQKIALSDNTQTIMNLGQALHQKINITSVGASGAIFGILFAFAIFFPNIKLMLFFPPIPIKAIYFVSILALIELYGGFQNNPQDPVAHFAHLGGLLGGTILLSIWFIIKKIQINQKQKNGFY